VHRASFEVHHGPIPLGAVVMHTCDHPLCINPAHLQLGTQQDNVSDKMTKGRHRTPSGIYNGRSKLTELQVGEIRRRFVAHDRINGGRPLAREFGISPTSLRAIVRGRSWR